jgi:hypothetical protein
MPEGSGLRGQASGKGRSCSVVSSTSFSSSSISSKTGQVLAGQVDEGSPGSGGASPS